MKRLLLILLALITIAGTAGARQRKLDLNVEQSQDAAGIVDSVSNVDDTLLVTVNGAIDYFTIEAYIQQLGGVNVDSLYMRYRPLAARQVEVTDSAGTRTNVALDTMAAGSNFTPIAWVQSAGSAAVVDTVCDLISATRGLFYSYVPNRLASSVGDAFNPPSSKCWQFLYKTNLASTRDLKVYLFFNFQRKR